jgi:hypothetical protein
MDTFAEMVPTASLSPHLIPRLPPQPPKGASALPPTASMPSTLRTHASRRGETRISVDPMQATDRYRLVMPYDQRL